MELKVLDINGKETKKSVKLDAKSLVLSLTIIAFIWM